MSGLALSTASTTPSPPLYGTQNQLAQLIGSEEHPVLERAIGIHQRVQFVDQVRALLVGLGGDVERAFGNSARLLDGDLQAGAVQIRQIERKTGIGIADHPGRQTEEGVAPPHGSPLADPAGVQVTRKADLARGFGL